MKRSMRDNFENDRESDDRYSKCPRLEQENEQLQDALLRSSTTLAEVYEELQESKEREQRLLSESKKQADFLSSEIVAVTRLANEAKAKADSSTRLLDQARAETAEEHERVVQLQAQVQLLEQGKTNAAKQVHSLQVQLGQVKVELKSRKKIKVLPKEVPRPLLELGLATWESDPVAFLTKRFIVVGAHHPDDETDEEKKLNPIWIAKLDLPIGVQLGQHKGAILAGKWAIRKTPQSVYKLIGGPIDDSNLGFNHVFAALDRLPDSVEVCNVLRDYASVLFSLHV